MFLDDINRDNQGRSDKWQYWDHHEYVSVGETEVIVGIPQGMNLVTIKNMSSAQLIVSMGGMHTMVYEQGEKHFTEIVGTQVILRMKSGEGRVFVGQSRNADTSRLPDMMRLLVCGFFLTCCIGCVQVTEYDDPFLSAYQVVPGPHTSATPRAAAMPQSPSIPDMPVLTME